MDKRHDETQPSNRAEEKNYPLLVLICITSALSVMAFAVWLVA